MNMKPMKVTVVQATHNIAANPFKADTMAQFFKHILTPSYTG